MPLEACVLMGDVGARIRRWIVCLMWWVVSPYSPEDTLKA